MDEQLPAAGPALAWARRNNGLMLHAPDPKTMLKDPDFPISIEVQLLGGLADGKPRTTATSGCAWRSWFTATNSFDT